MKGPRARHPRLIRAQEPLPSHFQVEEDDGTIRIRWRWFIYHKMNHNVIIGCVITNCLLIFYIHQLVFGSPSSLGSLLFAPIVPLAVGLTYAMLRYLLNHTTFEVSRNRLSIRHGPIPSGATWNCRAAN